MDIRHAMWMVWLVGCSGGDGQQAQDITDLDGDGFTTAQGDCDDDDASRHPMAEEGVADGVDQDCDGQEHCYVDGDGDGFGVAFQLVIEGLDCDATQAPAASNALDCDDADIEAYPGGQEVAGDARDQDCDGFDACFEDLDGDGQGSDVVVPVGLSDGCPGGAGLSTSSEDCLDLDPQVYVGARELLGDGVDQDCDGSDLAQLTDGFEGGALNTDLWAALEGDAGPTSMFMASGTRALVLAGGGGQIDTVPIPLQACDTGLWGYQGKRGPEAPDADDALLMEALEPDGTWRVIDAWFGTGLDDLSFQERWGAIPMDLMLAGPVQLRLRSDGSGVDYDHFFVDDVVVGCDADSDGDGAGDQFDCAPLDEAHWSDCGLCIDADGDGLGENCDLGIDCDDADASIHPGAPDLYGDGIDQDCGYVDGPGFFDTFEELSLDPFVWSESQGTFSQWARVGVDGSWGLVIDGGRKHATTHRVDYSSCDAVLWSYWGMRDPLTPPHPDDLLTLEAGSDIYGWVTLDQWPGDAVHHTDFALRWGSVPLALLDPTRVQLRLSHIGQGDSSVDYYIDDFLVRCATVDEVVDADGDHVPGAYDCDDTSSMHWSDCGQCTDYDGDGYGQQCDMGPDCNDTNGQVYPGAVDQPADGVDASCNGLDGPGIRDEFQGADIDQSVWDNVLGVPQIVADSVVPGNRVLVLSAGGDQLRSAPFATESCDEVGWSYYVRRGPDAPELGESLRLEVREGSAWVPLDVVDGTGTEDAEFSLRQGTLSHNAIFQPDLVVRLYATGGSFSYDHFYVDAFRVGCAAPDGDGDGVASDLDCDDGDPHHWSDCGTCSDGDGDGFGSACDLGLDCDDLDASVHPQAVDVEGDGVDQDCSGADGQTIFSGFEDAAITASVWTDFAGGAAAEVGMASEGLASLRLGGGESGATTSAFDTQGCVAVWVRFQAKRGPEAPMLGEDLVVSYGITGSAWSELGRVEGGGVVDAGFTGESFRLDDPAILDGEVAFRIANHGATAADHRAFYIDEFSVTCER